MDTGTQEGKAGDGTVLCKCGKPGTAELHQCPYQYEINDCAEDVCHCCEACTHECAMDI